MKLYVIQMDNGESFEDKQEWVGGIFSSKLKAIEYLDSINYAPIDEEYDSFKAIFTGDYGLTDVYYAYIEEFVLDYPDWEG